jgi:hypothetical protein
MPRVSLAKPVLFLALASLLAVLSACDGQAAQSPPAPSTPSASPPSRPLTARPAPAAIPRECSGQPCCGDPPRPCGEVIEDASGRACKTACDCGTQGLACLQGACVSGTVAVFCCDTCPKDAPRGQVCQQRDGRIGKCRKP